MTRMLVYYTGFGSLTPSRYQNRVIDDIDTTVTINAVRFCGGIDRSAYRLFPGTTLAYKRGERWCIAATGFPRVVCLYFFPRHGGHVTRKFWFRGADDYQERALASRTNSGNNYFHGLASAVFRRGTLTAFRGWGQCLSVAVTFLRDLIWQGQVGATGTIWTSCLERFDSGRGRRMR